MWGSFVAPTSSRFLHIAATVLTYASETNTHLSITKRLSFASLATIVLHHRFSAQGLSNLLWGLSHFRVRDQELLSLLAREAVYKMDEFKPLGLATLLSSWATAR